MTGADRPTRPAHSTHTHIDRGGPVYMLTPQCGTCLDPEHRFAQHDPHTGRCVICRCGGFERLEQPARIPVQRHETPAVTR